MFERFSRRSKPDRSGTMSGILIFLVFSVCAPVQAVPPGLDRVPEPAPDNVHYPAQHQFFAGHDPETTGILSATILIAFVDGMNPCSLWVLSMLLAMVLHSGSRKRTLVVGSVFLATTATVYGFFILGLFSIFSILPYVRTVEYGVGIAAIVVGILHLGDYFRVGTGFTLSIPDRYKPAVLARLRGTISEHRGYTGLVLYTVIMAGGIAFVELPCTAGFPVLWTGIVTGRKVHGAAFIASLIVYLFVYLLLELLVFAGAVIGLRQARMQEKHGRVLKLVGGTVMTVVGGVLIYAPAAMYGFGSSVMVFGSALGAAMIIHGVARVRQQTAGDPS
jgi:cytochrome c biogenesis protein CcdA